MYVRIQTVFPYHNNINEKAIIDYLYINIFKYY